MATGPLHLKQPLHLGTSSAKPLLTPCPPPVLTPKHPPTPLQLAIRSLVSIPSGNWEPLEGSD